MNLKEEFLQIFESCIRNISGNLGRKIRFLYYRNRLGYCGKNVVIDVGVIFQNPRFIFIDDNVWLDNYAILMAGPPGKERKILFKSNPDFLYNNGEIHIKKNVHIGPQVILQGHGGIFIGENAGVVAGAKVYSFSHHHTNLADPNDKNHYSFTTMAPLEDQFLICYPVVIHSKAAVGLNSVILPGTVIPAGTWVGVSTYISGSKLENNATYAGSPAQLINKR